MITFSITDDGNDLSILGSMLDTQLKSFPRLAGLPVTMACSFEKDVNPESISPDKVIEILVKIGDPTPENDVYIPVKLSDRVLTGGTNVTTNTV